MHFSFPKISLSPHYYYFIPSVLIAFYEFPFNILSCSLSYEFSFLLSTRVRTLPCLCELAVGSRYVIIGRNATKPLHSEKLNQFDFRSTKLLFKKHLSGPSSTCVLPPKVSADAKNVYKQFVKRGQFGPGNILAADLTKYQVYVSGRTLEVRDIRIHRVVSYE